MNNTKPNAKQTWKDKQRNEIINEFLMNRESLISSQEFEEVVLGTIIQSPSLYIHVDFLKPEMFYFPFHAQTFEIVQALHQSGQDFDPFTVAEELQKQVKEEELSPHIFVVSLTSKASHIDVVEKAQVIAQYYIVRYLRATINKIDISISKQTLPEDIIVELQSAIETVSSIADTNEAEHVGKIVANVAQYAADVQSGKIVPKFILSGWREFDSTLGGIQQPDLLGIAARPAMGKTAFGLSLAMAYAQMNIRGAFFSLEMTQQQLGIRYISSVTGIPFLMIKTAKFNDWTSVEAAQAQADRTPIYFDDTPALTPSMLRNKLTKLVSKHKIEYAVVDYLGLMKADRDTGRLREQEISEISRELKTIAKKVGIPIIVLIQLNRMVESRGGDKRPILSDLRDSGAIEQDLDMCVLLHRPEYYGMTEDEEGNSTANLAEIIIAKNRNGATRTLRMKFDKERMLFSEFGEEPTMPLTVHTTENPF